MSTRGRKTVAKRRSRTAALKHFSPVLASSSVGMEPPGPAELAGYVSQYCWWETTVRLAVLASMLTYYSGPDHPEVLRVTTDLFLRSDPKRMSHRGRAFLERIRRLQQIPPIASESAIYFLQAMALLHGRDEGPPPSDGAVAEMLVVANDYAFDWRRGDAAALTRLERSVANTSRALTFNRYGDPLRHLVRSYQMLRERPQRSPEWRTDENWRSFQCQALGMPLDEYLESFAIPLVLMSMRWGRRTDDSYVPPVLHPSAWWEKTAVADRGRAFIDSLTTTRAEARAAFRDALSDRGLPIGPTVFYRTPFVRIPGDRVVAVSPGMVREHIRSGLWGRHRQTMKNTGRWPSVFGDLFEAWCQRVAGFASEQSVDEIRVPDPDERGSEREIEDILIRKNDKVALISVKASAIPERTMRGAESAGQVVDWFDRYLFSAKGMRADGQGHAGGAVRKLHAKIDRLRSGEYEGQGLERTLKVFPVVLSYELGLDSPAVYRWTEDRCRTERLLTQSRVTPLTYCSVEDFEGLLALSTYGHSVLDMLRQKTAARWKHGRLNVLLHERAKDPSELRLGAIERLFDEITQRSARRVFGESEVLDPGGSL